MTEVALTAPNRLQETSPNDHERRAKQISGARIRLNSIDLLRGTVMILMALDHTREFFGASNLNVRDVTAPALFLTRWITHFCAPTFILLAGVSAYLYGTRGRTKAEVSRFLLTRGLWLIFVEFVVVRLAFSFALDLNIFVIQVIAALGASMMVLGGLTYLPRWLIATVAAVMICGHNLLDGIRAESLGPGGGIWHVLHQPGLVQLGPDVKLYVLYPLIPWIGVMAAGYVLGPWFELERSARLRRLVVLGTAASLGFIVLRAANVYGDPAPWKAQSDWLSVTLSFLNCEKYPPSLLFLAMTLGPALLLLAAFESVRGRVINLIVTYGRVPLFYYVTHLFLIHALAVALAWLEWGDASFLFGHGPAGRPAYYGLALPAIYMVWLFVIAALYPLCRWFAMLKQRRSEWWWSYI